MLTKKKWALFSLLTLCGGTIYKLPSLKDAFYIPMQEYFHLTNGQIGNAMSVNSFVTTVGFFLSIYFADKIPRRYTMSFSLIATGLLGVYLTTMPGYWAEESPENETDIALCDLLICANNSMRSLLCLFIKYVRISSGMP